ncbi:MAG: hypothetical protein Q9225_003345 [Loekoesia sp. 1 TL-2023]
MGESSNSEFRRIGQGFCGTVWAPPLQTQNARAMKREDGGPGRSLDNDYIMHKEVLTYLSSSRAKVCVPTDPQLVLPIDTTWWDQHLSRFPKDYQQKCKALVTERIKPFPKAVRDTIVELYCPEPLKPSIESIKSSWSNEDCLIRPYLGRRRPLVKHTKFQSFSLRNFPLHLDQFGDLALEGIPYARIMAETLAQLYWGAHVDANDVEFVLAPPRKDGLDGETSIRSLATKLQSPILGEHTIWILDFDCCKSMPFDESGVEQAVAAYYRNDPYYPRPGREKILDQTLWKEFRDRFLEASEVIIDQKSPEARLPPLWAHEPLNTIAYEKDSGELRPGRWADPSAEMQRDLALFSLGIRQATAGNLATTELFMAVGKTIETNVLKGAKPMQNKFRL